MRSFSRLVVLSLALLLAVEGRNEWGSVGDLLGGRGGDTPSISVPSTPPLVPEGATTRCSSTCYPESTNPLCVGCCPAGCLFEQSKNQNRPPCKGCCPQYCKFDSTSLACLGCCASDCDKWAKNSKKLGPAPPACSKAGCRCSFVTTDQLDSEAFRGCCPKPSCDLQSNGNKAACAGCHPDYCTSTSSEGACQGTASADREGASGNSESSSADSGQQANEQQPKVQVDTTTTSQLPVQLDEDYVRQRYPSLHFPEHMDSIPVMEGENEALAVAKHALPPLPPAFQKLLDADSHQPAPSSLLAQQAHTHHDQHHHV